jgi:methylenetetrahydrofolate dehydrogenase (NADP+)/methenyltetrahydrofolate cyclohydrolase
LTARLLSGKPVAAEVRQHVQEGVSVLKENGIAPGLAAILVGDNPASQTYVSSKQKAAEAAGINSWVHRLDSTTSQSGLNDLISELNADQRVHGILLQLPLPKGLDPDEAVQLIDPSKDVDGLTASSAGMLALARPRFVPCTALGVAVLLRRNGVQVAGSDVVVVGRSNLVGRPLSILLSLKAGPPFPAGGGETINLAANATVTLCHTGTKEMAAHTRQADILVVAAGSPRGVSGDMIKPGSTVIDVGIQRDDSGKLVGDVDFESASEVAGAITPVPGGVGPMTVAILLYNTMLAAQGPGAPGGMP